MTERSKMRVIQEAEHFRAKGYAAGLAAAREAVAALFPQERYPDEHAAILAAIDALRGERK